MKSLLESLRTLVGSEPQVEHPRRNLEQFFLEVVEQARKQAVEQTGVTTGNVADYLVEGPARSETAISADDPDAKLKSILAGKTDPSVKK